MRLTLVTVLKSHAAYHKIQQGLALAKEGYEDLFEAGMFSATPTEEAKIKKNIAFVSSMMHDMAQSKGYLVKIFGNIDAKCDVFKL